MHVRYHVTLGAPRPPLGLAMAKVLVGYQHYLAALIYFFTP